MWQLARSIVLEQPAQADVDRYRAVFQRFEEAWMGIEWLLARTPEIGFSKMVEGREFWLDVRAEDELAGTPRIATMYTFDNEEVVVYGVWAQIVAKEEQ